MADLQDLLVKTSRTFAASIPLLEEPTRRQVTIAYLLFRIADTFEDAFQWPQRRRLGALDEFAELIADDRADTSDLVAGWLREAPSSHAGYVELLANTPAVVEGMRSLADRPKAAIVEHTLRTATGMKGFVSRSGSDGVLRLEDLDDLRAYCYVVAGIVGEMLTELFLLQSAALESAAEELRSRAALFGEALQLVNILKDSQGDEEEGRLFLPEGLDRVRVFELARSDLGTASDYVRLVQDHGGAPGSVAFTALPVRLAWATLDEVERRGPGAKVSRELVLSTVADVQRAVAERRSPVPG